MKYWAMICVATMAAALSGCHKKPADTAASDAAAAEDAATAAEAADQPGFLGLGSKHGRYSAVGIYQPGESWSKMIIDQRVQGDPAPPPLDDQAIIVLADSQSGEVRACGDMSGYCVGMNPWKTALTGAQIAPIRLKAQVKSAPPADSTVSAGSAAGGPVGR